MKRLKIGSKVEVSINGDVLKSEIIGYNEEEGNYLVLLIDGWKLFPHNEEFSRYNVSNRFVGCDVWFISQGDIVRVIASELPKKIKNAVADLVSDFLNYDSKEDEDLSREIIENDIKSGKYSIEDIVLAFRQELEKTI